MQLQSSVGTRMRCSCLLLRYILWCTKGVKSTDTGRPIKYNGAPIKNTGVPIILSVHRQFYRSTDKFYRYGLQNHAGGAVSLYDDTYVLRVCFDVSITFVSTCCWCVFWKVTRTKCVFAHVKCECDRTHKVICMSQHSFINYRSFGWYTICFKGFKVTMD